MKTIIVTGGLGFIGSNFIQMMFQKYGDQLRIINIDKDTLNRKDHKHLNHIKQIHNQKTYIFKQVDICNTTKIQRLMFFYKPINIVHFAAESHVDTSIQTPKKHAQTNIFGTISLLIASSKYYNSILTDSEKKNFRFHHISTDQVFGDLSLTSNCKFNQSSIYNPSSPYSATKAGSDMLVRAWGRTYGLPWSISNCSNNYGKYQDKSKLIPKVINLCIKEQPITIHGTGQYIRDWIDVRDHCCGIIKILQNLQLTNNKTYLFGGDYQKSNLFIIDLICQNMDKILPRNNNESYKNLKTFVQNRQGQDLKYAIDSSKSKQQLNWKLNGNLRYSVEELIKNKVQEILK